MNWIRALVVFVTLAVVDGTWITAAGNFYPKAPSPFLALFFTYEIIAAIGISYLEPENVQLTALVIAVWVYGTFNLTSIATNEKWTKENLVVDIVAGIVIYQIAFAVGYSI